jgi:hypothetical protein
VPVIALDDTAAIADILLAHAIPLDRVLAQKQPA